MTQLCTLQEIAVRYANRQPGMYNSLTEEAPILDKAKWRAASEKFKNVAEKVSEIVGPAFVESGAPLPYMRTSSDLVTTDLFVMGGTMVVESQKALKFGGMEKYFAERQDLILKHAGMTTERQLFYQCWLEGALREGKVIDAGGKGDGWPIVFTRFDEIANTGLYDPDQFVQGRLLTISFLNGGKEHRLTAPEYRGVLGFEIAYRGSFGWQIIDAQKTCAAIVNVDEEHKPTAQMIDDLLSEVRARPNNTCIFCSPKAKIYGLNVYKTDRVELINGDNDPKTRIDAWNGIPIVTSYNIMDRQPNVKVKK